MANFDTIDDSNMEKAQAPILMPLRSHLPGLIETWKRPAVSLGSMIDACKDRIMQDKVASWKKKSELGELEGLLKLNFCDEVEWVGLGVHYKKRNLEDHLFKKNPAIEPESCNKLLKIAIGVDRSQAFHHVSEEQDTYKDIKLNNILIDLEVSNMLLDRATKSTSRWNNYATNIVDGFTSLNIPSVSQEREKTNMEIGRTAVRAGAPTTKSLVEMASEWWRDRSYLHKTWPMKAKNESKADKRVTLLLIFTLLATITFHTALKFYLPRCRPQEGYEANSTLDSNFQIENQSSYSTRILFMLNSVAFFLSAGMMMVLFNKLPYRPWLLVLVFSMIGSYICLLTNPMNPSLCSS